MLVRMKLKRMEIEIRKRESVNLGSSVYNEIDTIAKFEVMDGAPVRGESIPIRMFLGAYPTLTPTFIMLNNVFSVRYYLNLVLVRPYPLSRAPPRSLPPRGAIPRAAQRTRLSHDFPRRSRGPGGRR
mmetsp:Transcript_24152/g.60159  ORF Transcript_24152/g.60159 Transcript_24152/m.60159 type:complete len:127 (+) Transcript_24152:293-673(+)